MSNIRFQQDANVKRRYRILNGYGIEVGHIYAPYQAPFPGRTPMDSRYFEVYRNGGDSIPVGFSETLEGAEQIAKAEMK